VKQRANLSQEAMKLETIERDFQKKVSSKIRLKSEGVDRYRVSEQSAPGIARLALSSDPCHTEHP
jgi:hypothetical protein